ncbi:hypothetical protein MTR62_10570 [Novosphingobium sp. 1949]|uniref:Pectate lyase superfamily protein domain-containing protein n=1 Tax=Novosphingobium organovorum TaxID=2930092 RepID=A0ABT0BDL5_9SPHN|nr:hypothetical protein [Novosphingobium organovorum]MCJ2183131.1 hypothetical protein [Novosphingobium organovorum]
MAVFIERQERRTIVLKGENTLEARRQANAAGDQALVAKGWASNASNSAASALAVSRFYTTLAQAIAATAPQDAFATTDTAVALAEGGANEKGVLRACVRTDTAPFYAHLGASFDPVSRTNIDDIVTSLNSISVLITEFGASGLEDCLAAFNAALAAVKAAGGGTIVFPYQGKGGWNLGGTAVVDADNVTIQLYDDVNMTSSVPCTTFRFEKPDGATLKNAKLICPGRKCTIDGNGASMSGYTYSAYATIYPAVEFRTCDGVIVDNVHVTNGLVNCLLVRFSSNILLQDCDGSHAVYDNGISINFALDYAGYDANDPHTWTNARLMRCRGFDNNAVGITNYGGYGHTWTDCEAWGNGQDYSDDLPWGGGMTVEMNGTYDRDSRTVIVNPKCTSNRNYDLLCSARGVKVIKPEFKNTIAPTTRQDSTATYGSSIIVYGYATLDVSGYGTIDSPGKSGIRVLATTAFPSLAWDGKIMNTANYGIHGQGVALLEVSERSMIDGAVSSGIYVSNANAAYNQGGGEVRVAGSIRNCGSLSVDVNYVASVEVNKLSLKDNRKNVSSGSQVRIQNASYAKAANIINDDANAKTLKIAEIASTCTYGHMAAISGDSTSMQSAAANFATSKTFIANEDLGWDLILEGKAAANASGGAAASGRNTRSLATTTLNRRTLATNIANGSFTLPAGTYRITAWAQAYRVDEHTLFLRDTTSATDITQGSTEFSDAAGSVPSTSRIDHVFTLTASTALSLQHYCKSANTTDGLGKAMTTQPGRFAWLGIRKLN